MNEDLHAQDYFFSLWSSKRLRNEDTFGSNSVLKLSISSHVPENEDQVIQWEKCYDRTGFMVSLILFYVFI